MAITSVLVFKPQIQPCILKN